MKAVISLGANLGDREKNLEHALAALETLCNTTLLFSSSVYETAAVDVMDAQPDYLNCIAVVETELSPSALLGACFGIESAAGRIRKGFKSPRVLDIDLLLYEGVTMDTKELTLPHPRMLQRAFVLKPLSELFPGGEVLGVRFGEYLDKVADQRVEKVRKPN